MPRIVMECPNCGQRGHIRSRVKSNDRICVYCGYVGDPKEFEVNPKKPKK